MAKKVIDDFLKNLRKSDLMLKVSPWMPEGGGGHEFDVRYVGIKVPEDLKHIIPEGNNMLLRLKSERTDTWLEFYLANQPPFFKIDQTRLREGDKWETILGYFKGKLKKDFEEYKKNNTKLDNIYLKLKPKLKKA